MDKSSSFRNIKKHYIFVLIILTLNRMHSTYSSYSNNKNIKERLAKITTRSQAVARIADHTASQRIIYLVVTDCC